MTARLPPLQYLALGDSYTIGEGVPAAARWPALVVEHLRLTGAVIDDPRIVAVTGWTTDELARGMDEAGLAPNHDLVTLQIGVNDQYRGRTVDDYMRGFGPLLGRSISLAGNRPARVVVISIPDWGVTRFARDQGRDQEVIAASLDAFNENARRHVERAGAHFVDITTFSRRHPDLLADDGLHPSAAQYARWVEVILPAVREALCSTP